MPESTDNRPPVSFWIISIALLLWGLGGASIYVAYFIQTPEEFAETAETVVNRNAYAEYVANIPVWAIAVGIGAAFSRLLGAMLLLLRRAWALPFYIVSLILFMFAMYRAFVLADAASVMSGAHIAVELVFIGLSILAIWFAHVSRSKGVLK